MSKTYWSVCVSHNENHSSHLTTGVDLPDALARAFEMGSYYLLMCGYSVNIELQERCDKCHNEGVVLKRHKSIRCSECRGKVPTTKFTFPAKLHENVVHLKGAADLTECTRLGG